MPSALITGIAGQDGSYLAEFLLEKGYEVAGLVLAEDEERLKAMPGLADRVRPLPGDLTDTDSLIQAVEISRPDEVYNLAAQSSITRSWEDPRLTAEVTGLGAVRLLEAVRRVAPRARFFQASTSELFGNPDACPQTEETPFAPRNPYGHAKLLAHALVGAYRERHGLFAAAGILYNHESPRRPPENVTRKITRAAARIRSGLDDRLVLGDTRAVRDWGYAPDFVRAFWLMLQRPEPEDFIIATGEPHTVEDFCRLAFQTVGLDYRDFLEVNPDLFRSWETRPLVGNPAKAKKRLGWEPETSFPDLVRLMVEADLAEIGVAGRPAKE
jgi:GDPmannose 4,6-dehydratase